jgi:hypothetical protein
VVVALIQIKNLKIEAEKGFRRMLFKPELVDPNMEINFVKGLEVHPIEVVVAYLAIIHRKGNILNYNIRVNKESEVTHNADLTMSSNKRRVICSL